MKATFVFPNQLFINHPSLSRNRKVFIIQDPLFFGDYRYGIKFHKKKILLHLMSLDSFSKDLEEKGYETNIIPYKKSFRKDYLIRIIKTYELSDIYLCDPVDYILNKRIKEACNSTGTKIYMSDSPGFLLSKEQVGSEFLGKSKHLMAAFYKRQRRRYNILIDENDNPSGGKWSYDLENRKRLPKNIIIPKVLSLDYDGNMLDINKKFITKNFINNPGSIDSFNYPVDRKQAITSFHNFLEMKILNFGTYEDAIVKEETYLFHSVLSSYLNIGLITPQEVVNDTICFAKENSIPINSLEGFIRQIIGWREFMRGIYNADGTKQRNSNFWNFDRSLPNSFYDGTTGIEPLDDTINKVLDNAYVHHIERLMIIGNLMMLLGIRPDEVYKWFMELFIDSYDWVMVPNIYGMSQFSDGGLLATKPYLSGSNYILKMSNYKKGDWCGIWDSLFWRFINSNRSYFKKNYRMSMMVSVYDRKNTSDKKELDGRAADYIKNLFAEK